MSREVHNGPTDQHHQARGEPYRGDPDGGAGAPAEQPSQKLPLDSWHRAHGGRMVPFAGYEMPVQYEGIIAEHLWTRENAGLFDVSHMGQMLVSGANVAEALETLMPGDFLALAENKPKYSLLLADNGGIIDDLMATRRGLQFYVVVNGATKHGDIAVMRERLTADVTVEPLDEQALLALQGPRAADVLEAIIPDVSELAFMQAGAFGWNGAGLWISRSGYTGEDGFEISVPAASAQALADAIIAHDLAKPIGLGARDSLRLEAGLPLYGHDIGPDTTPVMAGLTFAINKRRRADGGFPGFGRIRSELEAGPIQKRVGLLVEGRQPVREGAAILDDEGNEVGRVTSGGFSPSLQRRSRGLCRGGAWREGARPSASARQAVRSTVKPMPFVPHRITRQTQSANNLV